MPHRCHTGTSNLVTLRCLVGLLVFFACALQGANADNSMPAETIEARSQDGRYLFRVDPACESRHQCIGRMYVRDGKSERLLWNRPLDNRVSPRKVIVSHNASVITFDNWSSVGYGKNVIAVYNPSGLLVSRYSLEQLLSEEELYQVPKTASSRWWMKEAVVEEETGRVFVQIVNSSKQVCIDLAMGRLVSYGLPSPTHESPSGDEDRFRSPRQAER